MDIVVGESYERRGTIKVIRFTSTGVLLRNTSPEFGTEIWEEGISDFKRKYRPAYPEKLQRKIHGTGVKTDEEDPTDL